jgi:hypothetical protein
LPSIGGIRFHAGRHLAAEATSGQFLVAVNLSEARKRLSFRHELSMDIFETQSKGYSWQLQKAEIESWLNNWLRMGWSVNDSTEFLNWNSIVQLQSHANTSELQTSSIPTNTDSQTFLYILTTWHVCQWLNWAGTRRNPVPALLYSLQMREGWGEVNGRSVPALFSQFNLWCSPFKLLCENCRTMWQQSVIKYCSLQVNWKIMILTSSQSNK